MDLVVYDDEERRYVPWMVSVAAVVLTALLAAGVTYLLAGPSDPEPQQLGGLSTSEAATAPSPTPEPSIAATGTDEGCAVALDQADAALQRSVLLEQALDEHTRIMDELLAERLAPEQALDQTLPVLTSGATERERFLEELAAYEQSRQSCPQ